MVSAAEASTRSLMEDQSRRFTPTHREAKRILGSGRMGVPIHSVRQTCFGVEELSTDWRREVGACGELYLPLFGSHVVDAMLWPVYVTPDRASAVIRMGSELSDRDINGRIGLTFANGKVRSIAFSLRSKEKAQSPTIIGSESAMTIKRNRIIVDGADYPVESKVGEFIAQMREFITSIQMGGETSVPGREGVKTMRVLDLARTASEQQTVLSY